MFKKLTIKYRTHVWEIKYGMYVFKWLFKWNMLFVHIWEINDQKWNMKYFNQPSQSISSLRRFSWSSFWDNSMHSCEIYFWHFKRILLYLFFTYWPWKGSKDYTIRISPCSIIVGGFAIGSNSIANLETKYPPIPELIMRLWAITATGRVDSWTRHCVRSSSDFSSTST